MKLSFDEPVQTVAPAFTAQPVNAAAQAVVPATSQSKSLVVVTDAMIDKIGQRNSNVAADFSKKMLVHVKASDVEGLGTKLNELVSTAKKLDPKRFQGGMWNKLKGLLGGFKEKMMAEYESVDKRITTLISEIDKISNGQVARVTDLEQLFELNIKTHDNYGQEIIEVEQMIVALNAQLAQEKTVVNPDSFAAQRINDIQGRIDRSEQKVDDLKRGQLICKNLAPQIRLMQSNARSLVQGIGNAKQVTIPAWSNAFFLYIINLEQKKGAEVKNAIHDATDEAFKMQADLLRQNTADIARANQRSVVSIETLQHMHTQLLGSMDDLQKITEEGKRARATAAPELQRLEQELVQKFLPAPQA